MRLAEPFTDGELETLTRLWRHVEKSFRLSVRLLDAELVQSALVEALGKHNYSIGCLGAS